MGRFMMKKYFAFIDESGILDETAQRQPFFAVGMLSTEDTSELTQCLMQLHYDYFSSQKELRNQVKKDLRSQPRLLTSHEMNVLLLSTRHHEYKFTHITPITVQKYIHFIDTACDFPIRFCALVIDKTDPAFRSVLYKNYWEAYIAYSKLLCDGYYKKDEAVCIIADYMNKPRHSKMYFERAMNELPCVFHTIRAHSETFSLLQVCDLLLGAVVFQCKESRGFVAPSQRAKAKQAFVQHLISKLCIPERNTNAYPLAQDMSIDEPISFSVHLQSLFQKQNGGV